MDKLYQHEAHIYGPLANRNGLACDLAGMVGARSQEGEAGCDFCLGPHEPAKKYDCYLLADEDAPHFERLAKRRECRVEWQP